MNFADHFENCTPHAINVHMPSGTVHVIPPSGFVARVACDYAEYGAMYGLPTVTKVVGQPDIGDWKFIDLGDGADPIRLIKIVSGMVLDALPQGFGGVVAPDTDKGAIRNEKGHVVGTTRFVVRFAPKP